MGIAEGGDESMGGKDGDGTEMGEERCANDGRDGREGETWQEMEAEGGNSVSELLTVRKGISRANLLLIPQGECDPFTIRRTSFRWAFGGAACCRCLRPFDG